MWSCDSGKVSPPPGKAQKRGGCPPPDYSTGFSAAFALCLGDLGRLSGRPRRSASPRQGGLSLSQGILARPTVCGLFIVTMHWDSKQCSDRYRSPEKHVCSKQWLCLPLNHNHIDAKLTCNITYALVKIIFYMEVNLKDSSDTGDPTNISLKGKLITAQNHFHSILMRCMTPTVIHDLVFKQLFEINNDNSMVWKEKQRPRISSRVITACPSMGTYSNSELSGISADFSGFVSFHDYFWYFYHRKWSEVAQSCLTLGDPMDYSPPGSSVGIWDFPGKSTGVGCHFLFQGDLPDPGIEPRFPTLKADAFTVWATREVLLQKTYLWIYMFSYPWLMFSLWNGFWAWAEVPGVWCFLMWRMYSKLRLREAWLLMTIALGWDGTAPDS